MHLLPSSSVVVSISGVAQNNNRQMDRARKASNERTTAAPPRPGNGWGTRHSSLPRQNGRRARYPRDRSDQSGKEAGPTDEGGCWLGSGTVSHHLIRFVLPEVSSLEVTGWISAKAGVRPCGREVGAEEKRVSLKVRHTKRRSSKERKTLGVRKPDGRKAQIQLF